MEPLPLLGEIDIDAIQFADRNKWSARSQYLGLEKGFGTVDTKTLRHFADFLETAGSPQDLECAASALIEASLFDPNRTPATYEANLYDLEYADLLIEEAKLGYRQSLEQGRQHPDDLNDLLRVELRSLFSDIYREIIEGKITPHTRDQTFARVALLGQYTLRHASDADPLFVGQAVELSYEIATIMASFAEHDQLIALPATPRANYAPHTSAHTCDLHYIGLDEGGDITLNVPVDIVSGEEMRPHAALRQKYDKKKVILAHTFYDLGIGRYEIGKFFNKRSINQDSRRQLLQARDGLFKVVSRGVERWKNDSSTT